MDVYAVYVLLDASNRVLALNSSAFLTDTAGWVQIDEGHGDRYAHAQGNYLLLGDMLPLVDDDGIYNYTVVDGALILRSETDKQVDRDSRPAPPPTETERLATLEGENKMLKAQVQAAATQQEFLEDCLIEIGQVVYA